MSALHGPAPPLQPHSPSPSPSPSTSTSPTPSPSINSPTSSSPSGPPLKAQTSQSLPENLFTWEAIWAFFMRAPRIRSWLFQKDSPPSQHVVQSLLSGPILTGYVFGSFSERVRSYSFPDIGDLHAVFCNDGDALLGFHFGFQGVQPIMPLIFEVAKDPCLGNPNVIVRRTARQKAPISGLNCYLAIEFNWFESGSLAVTTSVNPVDPTDKPPTGLTPFFDNAEIRVFNPTTAERFSKIADLYSQSLDFAYFPHPSNFRKLPDDFLDPPDDYYTMTIYEPVDTVYRSTLTPAHITYEQSFHAQNDFACVRNKSTSSQPPTGGAVMHCDRGDVSSVASPRTIALWKIYQQAVAHSRRTGLICTMLAKKVGGRFGKVVSMFGRDVRYTFLSTSGINVHGRIQRLCNQLGIIYSSPLPDTALISATSRQDGSSRNSPTGPFGSSENDVERELDITSTAFVRMGSGKRRMDQPQLYQQPQRYLGAIEIEAGKPSQHYPAAPSHGSDPTVSFQSTEGSFPPSISQSASTELRPNSISEHDSHNGTSQRNPKRRRYSPVSSTRTFDIPSEPMEEATEHSRPVVKQEADKELALINPGNLENHRGQQAQFQNPVDVQYSAQQSMVDRTPVRRRSFEITDMLSDESKFYPLQYPLGKGHTPSVTAPRVQTLSILQTSTELTGDGSAPPVKSELKPAVAGKRGTGTVWTCDRCGVHIRGKKGNLNRHIANKHDNIRAYACKVPNCGRKFQTRLNLVRHETAVHLGRPFTCPSCPRAFKYENDLTGHIKSAHENADATLACDICGSCFGRRSTLNRHKAKVHKVSEEPTSVT